MAQRHVLLTVAVGESDVDSRGADDEGNGVLVEARTAILGDAQSTLKIRSRSYW